MRLELCGSSELGIRPRYLARSPESYCADSPGYPPLASNPSIEMESAVSPMRMVLNRGYPPETRGNPRPHGMPPFAQVMSMRTSLRS
jgi:hypothetical protein